MNTVRRFLSSLTMERAGEPHKVPAKFTVLHPASTAEQELALNQWGRQPNGGLEGLAIVPRGTKLYGAMQRPLIQDSLARTGGQRTGTNTRIIEFDLTSGATREFLYVLENTGTGISEILAINDDQFFVLERDGKPGTEAVAKWIYKIDLAEATDVSNRETLPPEGVPAGVIPAAKSLFLDLLDSRWGLTKIAEITDGTSHTTLFSEAACRWLKY